MSAQLLSSWNMVCMSLVTCQNLRFILCLLSSVWSLLCRLLGLLVTCLYLQLQTWKVRKSFYIQLDCCTFSPKIYCSNPSAFQGFSRARYQPISALFEISSSRRCQWILMPSTINRHFLHSTEETFYSLGKHATGTFTCFYPNHLPYLLQKSNLLMEDACNSKVIYWPR